MCLVIILKNQFKRNGLSTSSPIEYKSWSRKAPIERDCEGQPSVTPRTLGEALHNQPCYGILSPTLRASLPMATSTATDAQAVQEQPPLYTEGLDEGKISPELGAESL